MARKLKSDKLLFTGHAAARLRQRGDGLQRLGRRWRWRRYQRARIYFLIKQAHVGAARPGAAAGRDAHRLPHYRQPVVIWTGARRSSALALVAVLFGRADQRRDAWLGVGGFGVQPSELAKIAVIVFIAALLERRMHRIDDVAYALLPIGDRRSASSSG